MFLEERGKVIMVVSAHKEVSACMNVFGAIEGKWDNSRALIFLMSVYRMIYPSLMLWYVCRKV